MESIYSPILHPGKSAIISYDKKEIGFVGEMHPEILAEYNIKKGLVVSTIFLSEISTIDIKPKTLKSFSNFPFVQRDISILIDKNIETTTEGRIGPYPIGVPMLDMHTIGAGGGSVAFVDEGGLLRVGPKSSGAEPGPACYGKGGLEATVTDAHLVLGRLSEKSGLAGGLKLDKNLANRQISKLSTRLGLTIEEAANGIIQIANEHMIKAIRLISVNRGYDPKDFVLFSFGGAGGLHVCEIAEGMQMEKAIVPAYGGVLSALGMLVADRGRQFVRTVNLIADNSSNTCLLYTSDAADE